AQNAEIILAFNEPDLASQSNLSPSDASHLWQQYIEPLRTSGIRLGAPAVTNAPTLHWYGEDIGAFYDYIWSMHGQFPNYPIWITEFASTSSDDA
ncbi:hypothetical protein MPER_14943, partial [Moniliophthora perniciosa FA553]